MKWTPALFPALSIAWTMAINVTPMVAYADIFQGNHPSVEKGHQAFQNGQFEDALKAYKEAEKELPNSPELKFNQGNAYMSLGRPEDAKQAYESALSGTNQELKAKDYYNLGNAFAALKQNDNAISAFRQALKADPHLELARRNLEILLRQKNQTPPNKESSSNKDPQNSPSDEQNSKTNPDEQSSPQPEEPQPNPDGDSPPKDQSPDKSPDKPDDKSEQSNKPTDPQANKDKDSNQAPNQNQPNDGEKESAPSESGEPIDRREAQRLLDAMRRNEKQFFMPQHNGKVKPRVPPDKDW